MTERLRSRGRREFLSWITKGVLALAVTLWVKPSHLLAHDASRRLGKGLGDPRYSSLLAELIERYNFTGSELKHLFANARLHPQIPAYFSAPPEALPYSIYRDRHITPRVISNGRRFLNRNRSVFDRTETTYEVDSRVIAAILGIETKFGRLFMRPFKVFDALNTIFTEIPRKEAFARRELIEFLLLCREEGFRPMEVEGSFAGAMGMPQFLPSSYRLYGVDFNGDGHRDLWKSPDDIIGSVAYYLRSHGWERTRPMKIPVSTPLRDPLARDLADQGLKGETTVGKLQALGVTLLSGSHILDPQENISLVYQKGGSKEKVEAVFPNFRVILKYNRSINYAMVVSDLTDALKEDGKS